jgi:hypothetical protein
MRAIVAPACLVLLLLPGPRAATSLAFPQEQLEWFEAPPAAGWPALLTLPPGWAGGDAAGVLLAAHRTLPAAHAQLRDAMLAQRAAVLELELPDGAEDCVATGTVLLEAGAAMLREKVGAGPVVAIGFGCAGAAALEATAGTGQPFGGTRHVAVVAAVALDGGVARFRAGPEPSREEGWPMRASLFCEAVAEVAADGLQACLAALSPAFAKLRRD